MKKTLQMADSMTLSKSLELPVLLHIGYPKTGSTWMQHHIFDNHALGFSIPWSNSRQLAISHFVICNHFNFAPNQAINSFYEGMITSCKNNLIPVISDETLGGDPLNWHINPVVVSHRLHDTFPQAKIFMSIREQKSSIISFYSEYIKHGGTHSFNDFIGVNNCLGKAPIFDITQLEYDKLINYYQSIFGKENVLVLPFELFIMDKYKYINLILQFLKIETNAISYTFPELISNKAHGSATLSFKRKLNRITKKPDYTNKKQPLSFRINRKISSIIDNYVPRWINKKGLNKKKLLVNNIFSDRFKKSNKKTSQLIGIDLTSYNYDVS
jgi:hypothetical protein